jgi:hypothetical protein
MKNKEKIEFAKKEVKPIYVKDINGKKVKLILTYPRKNEDYCLATIGRLCGISRQLVDFLDK